MWEPVNFASVADQKARGRDGEARRQSAISGSTAQGVWDPRGGRCVPDARARGCTRTAAPWPTVGKMGHRAGGLESQVLLALSPTGGAGARWRPPSERQGRGWRRGPGRWRSSQAASGGRGVPSGCRWLGTGRLVLDPAPAGIRDGGRARTRTSSRSRPGGVRGRGIAPGRGLDWIWSGRRKRKTKLRRILYSVGGAQNNILTTGCKIV